MSPRARIAATLFAASLLAACGDDAPSGAGCAEGPITTDSGLEIEEIRCGDGDEAKTGSTVSVHYVGTLESGDEFDSSRVRGQPFTFTLGAGDVIPGWDEGIVGMRVGGIRKLRIPSELGYGPRGYPPDIPPNATLIFEVELVSIAPAG